MGDYTENTDRARANRSLSNIEKILVSMIKCCINAPGQTQQSTTKGNETQRDAIERQRKHSDNRANKLNTEKYNGTQRDAEKQCETQRKTVRYSGTQRNTANTHSETQ